MAKSVGKFFKKLFRKRKASEITNRLIDSLDYGTNINLFIIKAKAKLLLMFRNFQLQKINGVSVNSCKCKSVLKYIDNRSERRGYNEKFLNEMKKTCQKLHSCDLSGGRKFIKNTKKKC